MNQLRSFLFESVYTDSVAKTEDAKAGFILRSLFDYYCLHADELPPEFHPLTADDVTIKVVDYVAGMTDRFALNEHSRLFDAQIQP